MKRCPFCPKEAKPMEPVGPVAVLQALGVDMESTLGGMLRKALNPRGQVYRCPSCGFVAIFSRS